MKIAFPLVETGELAEDFASSRFIGLYEESEKEVKILPMESFQDMFGNLPEKLISYDLKAIVSHKFSILSLRLLKEYGIDALQACSNDLEENIKALASGQLLPFDIYKSVLGEMCASGCSSCNSSCT